MGLKGASYEIDEENKGSDRGRNGERLNVKVRTGTKQEIRKRGGMAEVLSDVVDCGAFLTDLPYIKRAVMGQKAVETDGAIT